ncbi:MAG TPA: 2'-5' RNA ligase family protein, partial [Gemmatimonadaceae bacterium]|nr:2'-5' RNA ligase family protein [Gemmatimonadaceae bacterium]
MKPGIVIITPIEGEIGERIHALQQRVDPRMARELPPHVTLIGSSGLGPLPLDTSTDRLRAVLEAVASTTPPIRACFDPPMRFMQTDLVVLPLDPHGPLRALHERLIEQLRAERIVGEQARFTFTPHCTLNFYRELPAAELRELLAVRMTEPVTIDRLQAFKTLDLTRTRELLSVGMGA